GLECLVYDTAMVAELASRGRGDVVRVSICALLCMRSFFFFQAEDGIRDFHVTGVQTCALPISGRPGHVARTLLWIREPRGQRGRSEERRVGKECRSRGSRHDDKKKQREGQQVYRDGGDQGGADVAT